MTAKAKIFASYAIGPWLMIDCGRNGQGHRFWLDLHTYLYRPDSGMEGFGAGAVLIVRGRRVFARNWGRAYR